ncbi:MAG: hypothetical protein RJA10_2165 [Pseudomonadota bacterium]|jgi:ferrous iron transport protein A
MNTVHSLAPGQQGVVKGLVAPTDQPEWAQHLADLGFVTGEVVTLLRRGLLGGDPLVVRVGLSKYALRGAEARCVHIEALPR